MCLNYLASKISKEVQIYQSNQYLVMLWQELITVDCHSYPYLDSINEQILARFIYIYLQGIVPVLLVLHMNFANYILP